MCDAAQAASAPACPPPMMRMSKWSAIIERNHLSIGALPNRE
jgi:hypothetical protein